MRILYLVITFTLCLPAYSQDYRAVRQIGEDIGPISKIEKTADAQLRIIQQDTSYLFDGNSFLPDDKWQSSLYPGYKGPIKLSAQERFYYSELHGLIIEGHRDYKIVPNKDSCGLSPNKIIGVLVDKKRDVWINSYRNGLYHFKGINECIEHVIPIDSAKNKVLEIRRLYNYPYNDSLIVLFHINGISLLNTYSKSLSHIYNEKISPKCHYFLSPKRLLVGTWFNGLIDIDIFTGSASEHTPPESQMNINQALDRINQVSTIIKNEREEILVAFRYQGVFKYTKNGFEKIISVRSKSKTNGGDVVPQNIRDIVSIGKTIYTLVDKQLYRYNDEDILLQHILRRKARGLVQIKSELLSYGISDYIYKIKNGRITDSIMITHRPVKANFYGIKKAVMKDSMLFLAGSNALYKYCGNERLLRPLYGNHFTTNTDRDEIRSVAVFNDSLYVFTKRGGIKIIDINNNISRSEHVTSFNGSKWHFFRDTKTIGDSIMWFSSENGLIQTSKEDTTIYDRSTEGISGVLIGLVDRFDVEYDTVYGVNDQGHLVKISKNHIENTLIKVNSSNLIRDVIVSNRILYVLSRTSISTYNLDNGKVKEREWIGSHKVADYINMSLLNNSIISLSGNKGHLLIHKERTGEVVPLKRPELNSYRYINSKDKAILHFSKGVRRIDLPSYVTNISLWLSATNHIQQQELLYSYDGNIWTKSSDMPLQLNISTYGTHELSLKTKVGVQESETKRIIIYKEAPIYLRWWFWVFVICTIGAVFYVIYKLRVGQIKRASQKEIEIIRKAESEKTALQIKINNLEMQALQSQMNPHFVFNSINSLKSLMLKGDKEKSIDYLEKFSTIVRKILNTSRNKLILLEEDVSLLKLYTDFEKLRFDQNINIIWSIDQKLDLSFYKIPPLIVQPFVENAIWHGLLHLTDRPPILKIDYIADGLDIVIIIEDNGIGRKRSQDISQRSRFHKSIGMHITNERIHVYQKATGNQIKIEVEDFPLDMGTKVTITLVDHI